MAGGRGTSLADTGSPGLGHAAKKRRLESQADVARPGTGPNTVEIAGKSCTHEVSWPSNVAEEAREHLPPASRAGDPAKRFPFSLDPFQQTAVNCLEAGKI